jgi:hypothetical protein
MFKELIFISLHIIRKKNFRWVYKWECKKKN